MKAFKQIAVISIGITKRLHWPFKDPETLTGNHEEQLDALRVIRDQIRDKLTGWLKTL